MSDKIRLDVYMCENKLTQSREKARELIKNLQVKVNDCVVTKPGTVIDAKHSKIEIIGEILKYVSRGGLKLEKALDKFMIDLKGKTAIDIGASTGGFTDCMLKRDIKKVYAVDVGSKQLSEKLLEDMRVINMENTNIRYVTPDTIGEKVDFISVDVSFISLKLVIPIVGLLLKDDAEAILLIKPQFEAGKKALNKKGIIRDIKTHADVCRDIVQFVKEAGLYPINIDYSPVQGGDGNIEYLIHIKKRITQNVITDEDVINTVKKSHINFADGR